MEAQNSLKNWFYSIPPFSRTYLVILLLMGFGSSMGFVDPFILMFSPTLIFKRFELWRLISSFFYIGGPSMSFLMNMMIIMSFYPSFETNPISCTRGAAGDTADFIFDLFWGVVLNIAVACVYPRFFLSVPLLYYVIYIWSKQNPNTPRSFWGFSFKGLYIPFVLILFSLLVGSPITELLIGIGTGHLFYYFSQVNEKTRNSKLFTTPHFLRRLLSIPESKLRQREEDSAFRRKWQGRGYQLGTNM